MTIADYSLNVTNIYTLYYLHKLGIQNVCLSVELTDSEIINMIKNYNKKFKENANVELLTYGRVENMLIKGNILGIEENKHNYNLIDLKRRKFPVYYDGENTHLLNFTTKEITDKNILKNVNTLRFDFYEETAEDIKKIVKQFQ